MDGNDERLQRIMSEPAFQDMARRRSRVAKGLAILIGLFYLGFISLMAFGPKAAGGPLDQGIVSIGLAVFLVMLTLGFLAAALVINRNHAKQEAERRAVVERHQ